MLADELAPESQPGMATLTRDEFETLALQQLDGLYAAALHLTRNPADARDLVHDAYLRAFRFRHRFRAGTNFRGWFFKLLYRLFVNQYHRRTWEREHLTAVEAGPAAPALDPEAATLLRLDVDTLQRALQDVPEVYRTPVVLCDVNEFSYEEIAQILEIPIGTVMSRLFRGRRFLRQRLAELEATPGVRAPVEHQPIDIQQYRQQRGSHGL